MNQFEISTARCRCGFLRCGPINLKYFDCTCHKVFSREGIGIKCVRDQSDPGLELAVNFVPIFFYFFFMVNNKSCIFSDTGNGSFDKTF
jgi:hypothetical protein